MSRISYKTLCENIIKNMLEDDKEFKYLKIDNPLCKLPIIMSKLNLTKNKIDRNNLGIIFNTDIVMDIIKDKSNYIDIIMNKDAYKYISLLALTARVIDKDNIIYDTLTESINEYIDINKDNENVLNELLYELTYNRKSDKTYYVYDCSSFYYSKSNSRYYSNSYDDNNSNLEDNIRSLYNSSEESLKKYLNIYEHPIEYKDINLTYIYDYGNTKQVVFTITSILNSTVFKNEYFYNNKENIKKFVEAIKKNLNSTMGIYYHTISILDKLTYYGYNQECIDIVGSRFMEIFKNIIEYHSEGSKYKMIDIEKSVYKDLMFKNIKNMMIKEKYHRDNKLIKSYQSINSCLMNFKKFCLEVTNHIDDNKKMETRLKRKIYQVILELDLEEDNAK